MKNQSNRRALPVKNRLLGAAFIAGVMSLAGNVQATPITVDLSFEGRGLFPAGSRNTHIRFDNADFDTGSMHVAAGMFGGQATNGVNFETSTLYRNEDNVLAYCVDIVERLLRQSNTYNVNDVAQDLVVDLDGVRRDFGRTLLFLGAANEVARRDFAITEGDQNWLNPSASWMSAAFQVGIWESLYEESGQALNVGEGWFTATSIGTEGNQFLTDSFALMGAEVPPTAVAASRVKWLQIDGGQDLLVDPVDVPAPAPAALLLLGLSLLLRKRRR
ncbi:hypothetical protein [Congregibacter litoralis]|uniref:PEP-CTERM protein sorting domain protein n=1 Tax=Congregibacter litoralis KT71 TaxID=314285 RepID=A4A727_9GAMM|nr:hypothetical protein [Congregibacter litoralis]EAQ98096.1 hypothetical protein KT71_02577 [Congregibacter litoralis KT71]